MHKITVTLFALLFAITIYSQSQKPVWDIGTKWTYDFSVENEDFGFVINEIVDTITMDGLLLYQVDSYPAYTGIRYFYYDNNRVFSYKPTLKLLTLLYDFNGPEDYITNYPPICGFQANDSLGYNTYDVVIDSVYQIQMPDGTLRAQWDVRPVEQTMGNYEIPRSILSGIGFRSGYIHYTHDWELEMSVCDESANYIGLLRCFENDTVSYNFRTFPCDSVWLRTNTEDIKETPNVLIYPNPTADRITIQNLPDSGIPYKILNKNGHLLDQGIYRTGDYIKIPLGINIIKLEHEGQVMSKVIYNIGDLR